MTCSDLYTEIRKIWHEKDVCVYTTSVRGKMKWNISTYNYTYQVAIYSISNNYDTDGIKISKFESELCLNSPSLVKIFSYCCLNNILLVRINFHEFEYEHYQYCYNSLVVDDLLMNRGWSYRGMKEHLGIGQQVVRIGHELKQLKLVLVVAAHVCRRTTARARGGSTAAEDGGREGRVVAGHRDCAACRVAPRPCDEFQRTDNVEIVGVSLR